jgi:hypothetical protein
MVVWPVVAVVGTVAIWLPRNRPRFAALYPPEALFALSYAVFLVFLNSRPLVWNFPRFVIPLLPCFLYLWRNWIPRDRRVLWGAAVISALLSAAALVSFRNVFGFRL